MKKLVALLLALVLVVGLCACAKKAETTTPTDGSEQTSESAATAQSKGTIGITLPTQELARCLKDQEYLTQYLNERGYDVDVQFAKGDAATQVAQMENMITNGVVGIICSPWDGSALTSAVEAAHNAGIPVIAYDALILNTPYIEYYAADDLRGIGALQAQYIVDTLKLDSSDEAHTLELFAGDYADANAPLFFEGAMNVLTPYIESGKLVVKSGQTEFNVVATAEWDGAKAQSRMDAILSTYYLDEPIEAVLCQNDDLAAGVISACKSAGYGTEAMPLPITTGQDCTISAVKSILAGEQSMTVFKDIKQLAYNGAYFIDCLVQGQTPEIENPVVYNNGSVDVKASAVEPLALTADKVQELVIDSDAYVIDLGMDTEAAPVVKSSCGPTGRSREMPTMNIP